MNFDNYKFVVAKHREKDVIFIKFPYSTSLQKELRNRFPSAKYTATNKCWYLPDLPVVRE